VPAGSWPSAATPLPEEAHELDGHVPARKEHQPPGGGNQYSKNYTVQTLPLVQSSVRRKHVHRGAGEGPGKPQGSGATSAPQIAGASSGCLQGQGGDERGDVFSSNTATLPRAAHRFSRLSCRPAPRPSAELVHLARDVALEAEGCLLLLAPSPPSGLLMLRNQAKEQAQQDRRTRKDKLGRAQQDRCLRMGTPGGTPEGQARPVCRFYEQVGKGWE